jgi:nucleoside-diphosphate-sugar epimerase
MIVGITGASGFIGVNVCDELSKLGLHVRAMVRDGSGGTMPLSPDEVISVEYDDRRSIQQAVDGADTIVHLLGQAHNPSAHPDLYDRVNVTYAAEVAQAAVRAGVRRFILLSSVKVLGNGRSAPYRDGDTPAPEDPYGSSKWLAERTVQSIANGTSLDYVVLRPPLVYGAGVKGHLRFLIDRIERGSVIPIPSGAQSKRSLLSVRNLASAIARCICSEDRIEDTYLVSDETDVSISELVEAIASAAERPARTLSIPPPIFRYFATAYRKGSAAQRILTPLRVDSRPFRDFFGWHPEQTLVDGMREAVEVCRQTR